MSETQSFSEILIEIQSFGHALRVTAMEPQTLTEIVFQAPAGTPMPEIESLALAKMQRRLTQIGATAPI